MTHFFLRPGGEHVHPVHPLSTPICPAQADGQSRRNPYAVALRRHHSVLEAASRDTHIFPNDPPEIPLA